MMTPGAATTLLGDIAGGARHPMGPDFAGQDALIAVPAGLFNTLLNQTGAWIGNTGTWGSQQPHHFGGHHGHHQQMGPFGAPWQYANPWATQYGNPYAAQYGNPYAGQFGMGQYGPGQYGMGPVGQWGNPYAGQFTGGAFPFQVLVNGIPR
jgi:hypothetical protein